MKRNDQNVASWQVYEMKDAVRASYQPVAMAGGVLGSVSSWDDLDALAAEHEVPSDRIDGEGVVEMIDVLGAKLQ
jgi:hypothetical protein